MLSSTWFKDFPPSNCPHYNIDNILMLSHELLVTGMKEFITKNDSEYHIPNAADHLHFLSVFPIQSAFFLASVSKAFPPATKLYIHANGIITKILYFACYKSSARLLEAESLQPAMTLRA
ncbi:hypothetical protein AAHE18_03G216300 [Arachis hypogaea]